jgi:hypothetical protein
LLIVGPNGRVISRRIFIRATGEKAIAAPLLGSLFGLIDEKQNLIAFISAIQITDEKPKED